MLAPRAASENLRVFDRAKKAGRQIKAGDEHGTAGLFCLGITKRQDPHWLAERFVERFSAGNYSSLSTVLLVARAETGRPEEIPLDFALSLHNPKAKVALPMYQLQSSGAFVQLGPKSTGPVRISAYEYCHVECKAGTPTAGATGSSDDTCVDAGDVTVGGKRHSAVAHDQRERRRAHSNLSNVQQRYPFR